MRRPWLSHVFTACAVALCLSLTACEDPSGVGLIDEGGDPNARTLPALEDSLRFAPLDDATGSFLTASDFANFRGLAGFVDDPDYGSLSAAAYIDVLAPSNLPDGFSDRPIEQATLRLRRTYVYGDTTMATTLDVRQIANDWDAVGAPSDTTFEVLDELITSFDVSAADSLVEIPLPDSWIAANDTTLRSGQFSTLFHGFRLTPSEGGASAVYGFAGNSTLQLISAEDTVSYGVSELFSNVDAGEAPAVSGIAPLQDGTGRVLNLDFDTDALDSLVVNRAKLVATIDTAAAAPPAGFVRPVASTLALYGFLDEGNPVIITTATLNEDAQTFTFQSSVLTDIFQEIALGRSEVEGFFLGFPTIPSSIDAAPIVASTEDGCEIGDGEACSGPSAVLIVTPVSE